MSKLANLIEARQTGRMRVIPSSVSIVTVDEEVSPVKQDLYAEYRLGVTLTVKGHADPKNSTDIQKLKDMCKRQILHEVFGEFQPLIRRIERAIYELNFDEARTALLELDNEMRW